MKPPDDSEFVLLDAFFNGEQFSFGAKASPDVFDPLKTVETDVGIWWDWMTYLFSSTRRRDRNREYWRDGLPEPAAWSIIGASYLGVDYESGRPYRVCSPEEVRSVAQALAEFPTVAETLAALPASESPDRWRGYWVQSRPTDPSLPSAERTLEMLRVNLTRFFAEAARRGEATIHVRI